MHTAKPLALRFKEVILDGRWVAYTNFKDQIDDLDMAKATTKIGSLNTIAALTFHVNYYIAGVLQVLKGGSLDIRDKYSFEMPALKDDLDWVKLKNDLFQNARAFTEQLELLTEEQLKSHFVQEEYGSYQRNMDGMIEHCYYHLGQVVLIKKLILEKDA